MSVNMQKVSGWANVKAAAQYANVSERTFRDWLRQDLKYSKLPSGHILTKYEWIDQFLEGYEINVNELDKLVADTIKGLSGNGKSI